MTSPSSPSLPSLPSEEYINDCARAIIAHWQADPSHPEHLVQLAEIYEWKDDPISELTLAQMPELVLIFRESAEWYRERGADLCVFLEFEAHRLHERIQALQALSNDDDEGEGESVDDDPLTLLSKLNQRVGDVLSRYVESFVDPRCGELKHSHSASELVPHSYE